MGATFGLVYVVVNAGELAGAVALALRVAAVLAYAGLVARLLRSYGPHQGTQQRGSGFTRGFGAVVAAEVVAILVGNALLAGPLGLPEGVLAWVTTVVGLHFVALARVWRTRVWQAQSLYVLGAGLTACGVVGLGLASAGAGPAVLATVSGIVPGALLLAGSWWATRPGPVEAPRPPV